MENYDGNRPIEFRLTIHKLNSYGDWLSEIKPILRPLPDITEEERKDIWKIIFKREFSSTGQTIWFKEESLTAEPRWVLMSGVERIGIEMNGDVWADSDLHKYKFNPHEITHYLLSKHFDIFNLIPEGLAIDKTKQGI